MSTSTQTIQRSTERNETQAQYDARVFPRTLRYERETLAAARCAVSQTLSATERERARDTMNYYAHAVATTLAEFSERTALRYAAYRLTH